MKLTKAREQMEEARRLYEVLNKELHEELPALYDSRIPFYINMFQTLFTSETYFHQEYSKVDQKLAEMIESLAAEAAKGTFQSDAGRYLSQIQQQQQPTAQQSPGFKSKLDNQALNQSSLAYSPNSPTNPTIDINPSLSMDNNAENNLDTIELPQLGDLELNVPSSPTLLNNDDNQRIQSNGNCNDSMVTRIIILIIIYLIDFFQKWYLKG